MQSYIQQSARGAYLALICQPEASFDLSVAAQHKQPTKVDLARLNKRLKWQKKYFDRGSNNIILDISTAKLSIFANGSFASNADFSKRH